jgi:sugar phosphate isomerase/epimerase
MAQIELGINTCFAVKRWPRPRDWINVTKNELKLDVAQISTDLLSPSFEFSSAVKYMEEVKIVASDYDLEIHSLFTGLGAYSSNLLLSSLESERRSAFDWFCRLVDLANLVGAKGIGGHIGAISVDVNKDSKSRTGLIESLKDYMFKLADYAQNSGLEHLQFENLAVVREYGHSIVEAKDLEDSLVNASVPWILCLDVGHPAALGIESKDNNILDWISQTWRNTPVLQLQQSAYSSDRHAPYFSSDRVEGENSPSEIIRGISKWKASKVPAFFEIIHPHEASDELVLKEIKESIALWQRLIVDLGKDKWLTVQD